MLRRIALRLGRIEVTPPSIVRSTRVFPPRTAYSTQVHTEQPQDDFWATQLDPLSSSSSASSKPFQDRIYTQQGRLINSQSSSSSTSPSYAHDFFHDPLSTIEPPSSPSIPLPASEPDLPQYIRQGSVSAKPLATYVIPTGSGVEMIRAFMEEYKFLKTQQIWHMGTEGLKPALQPDHVVEADGRIRMKRVATWREQRRIWRPPPKERYPDHPFKSMNFLKTTILASLEAQELIHKTKLPRPLANDEEREAAVRNAERQNRKNERLHLRQEWPPPEPVIPKTTIMEWGWALGPKPQIPDSTGLNEGKADAGEEEKGYEGESSEYVMPPQSQESIQFGAPEKKPVYQFYMDEEAGVTPSGTRMPVYVGDPAEQSRRWERAAQLEEEFHKSKYAEALAIAERQFIRRTGFREARDKEKQEREEDEDRGFLEGIAKEKMRMEAVEYINNYARQTGEDVSEWYKELERPDWGVTEKWKPTHIHKGGVLPRKGIRATFQQGVMELHEADAGDNKIGGGRAPSFRALQIGNGDAEVKKIGPGDRDLIWKGQKGDKERLGLDRPKNYTHIGDAIVPPTRIRKDQAWLGPTDPRFRPLSADGKEVPEPQQDQGREYVDPRPLRYQRDSKPQPGFTNPRIYERSYELKGDRREGWNELPGGLQYVKKDGNNRLLSDNRVYLRKSDAERGFNMREGFRGRERELPHRPGGFGMRSRDEGASFDFRDGATGGQAGGSDPRRQAFTSREGGNGGSDDRYNTRRPDVAPHQGGSGAQEGETSFRRSDFVPREGGDRTREDGPNFRRPDFAPRQGGSDLQEGESNFRRPDFAPREGDFRSRSAESSYTPRDPRPDRMSGERLAEQGGSLLERRRQSTSDEERPFSSGFRGERSSSNGYRSDSRGGSSRASEPEGEQRVGRFSNSLSGRGGRGHGLGQPKASGFGLRRAEA